MRDQVLKNDKNTLISGTEVSLQALINLRYAASYQLLADSKKQLTKLGEKRTHIRGRGIEFDTTREYQTGDDIRRMAWRVMARSLKPLIKVYREEKERSVWLALDLSSSLYFGTRSMFKSVKMIEQAAMTGWSLLIKREHIGAIILADDKSLIYHPEINDRHYLTILNSLAQFSRLRPLFHEKNYLQNLLLALHKEVRTGHLIYIYSDFFHFNHEIEKLITHLIQRTKVILNFVYDPFEAFPPPPHQYLLTNGQNNVLFDMQNANNRTQYQQQFQSKVKQLMDFAHRYGMTLNLYCTDANQKVDI